MKPSSMLALAVLLTAAPLAAAHNGSQGTSQLVVDAAGGIDVTIELSAPDLVDLCGVELGRTDARVVTQALARGMPAWLVLATDDGRRCPLRETSFSEGPPLVVRLHAHAQCTDARGAPQLPRVLVIDWGLFAGTRLDHVSVARLVRPDGTALTTSFSRRSSHLVLDLPARRWWSVAALAAVFLAASAVMAGSMRRLSTATGARRP